MDTKQRLLEVSALTGVAGREGEAAAYAAELLRAYREVELSPLGSVICTVNAPKPGGDHVLLDAHIDEIGMVVTSIDKTGFLKVGPCGGMDRRLLAASPVTVHTDSGPLTGLICSVPPHLAGGGEKKNTAVEDIFIDMGLSYEAAVEQIMPGDVVTLQSVPRELLGGTVSGKALDDRAGCVSLLVALEALGGAELECGLTVVFSTMEEVGGQGAKTAAYKVAPTHAIAVDVSFAHTPDAKKEKCGELGGGPMIGMAPILSKEVTDGLIAAAKEQGIPFQYEVMGGRTGTNADAIAVSRGGVRTGMVSIPQKYMHTPIEVVAVSDVEQTGRLIAAYLVKEWGRM